VELQGLLAAQPAIAARGATLLLISPEPPSSELVAEVAALGDKIYLLHDPMLGVALSYGLVYMIPAALRQYYLDIDFDIPRMFSSGSWLMPLPADFLVGVDGRIALSYVDVDFTVRLDPARILEALSRLPA
jgi:peroxiredoxin